MGKRSSRAAFFVFAVFSVFLLSGSISHAAISVDDFLPPAQAAAPEDAAIRLTVENPAEVKEVEGDVTGEPAISAASAQDAINAWVAKRSGGFEEIVFPSGFGFVATGTSTYDRHDNPVAERAEKRNAYVTAYMGAKTQLAEGLNGVYTSGRTKAFERIARLDESQGQTQVNIDEETKEAIRQRVDAFLRGYVVYEVFDDAAASRVYVTIVTTSKTQGHYDRPDVRTVSALSMQEGLGQVFAEIEKGLTPPVGGRMIYVEATGEMAFVGFGSAVIGRNNNAAVQSKLELNSERIAKIRAKDALCGVIIGEAIESEEKLDSDISSMNKDFEELSKDDPIVKNNPDHPGYVKLQNSVNAFKAAEANVSVMRGAREGILPPGVRQEAWMDEDKAFTYAVAVYMPSASNAAERGAESMRYGSVITPPADGYIETPDEEVKQGPSGTVQDVNDL
ncbi:MAG: hypothetical protein LBS53_04790 [Synergistaceae bacterium]|nr:hypothetical protein [Synergistaceae bacterium]